MRRKIYIFNLRFRAQIPTLDLVQQHPGPEQRSEHPNLDDGPAVRRLHLGPGEEGAFSGEDLLSQIAVRSVSFSFSSCVGVL